ncbi:MAG: hypothetical protein RLZZ322_768, partial [Verrucomicrobiota bacterium]
MKGLRTPRGGQGERVRQRGKGGDGS